MTFPSGVDGEQTELKRTCIHQVARNSTPYKGQSGRGMWVFKGTFHPKINNTYYSSYHSKKGLWIVLSKVT